MAWNNETGRHFIATDTPLCVAIQISANSILYQLQQPTLPLSWVTFFFTAMVTTKDMIKRF